MNRERTEIGELLEDFDPPLNPYEVIVRKKNWDKQQRGGSKPHDLTNQRFGHLVAVRMLPKVAGAEYRGRNWECRCDCGAVHFVTVKALRSGNTQSCGCSRSERKLTWRQQFQRVVNNITPEDRAWAIEQLRHEN